MTFINTGKSLVDAKFEDFADENQWLVGMILPHQCA